MSYDKKLTVPVDKAKLYALLKEKGHTPKTLSNEIGHCDTYLYNYIGHTKGIPKFVVAYLEKWYQIPYSEYEYKEPEKPVEAPKKAVETPQTATEEEIINRLIKAFKEAVLSYNGQKAIAQTVRFVMREEPFEDLLKKIVQEAIEDKLG